MSRLYKYIDNVGTYEGGQWAGKTIRVDEITGRQLSLAIPKDSITTGQRKAFEAATARARSLNVDLVIKEF